jgi:hypothetical protein
MNATLHENGSQERLLDLNPMDLQDIVVRTFRVFMRRPLLFFGIVAVIGGIPMTMFQISIILFYEYGLNFPMQGDVSPGIFIDEYFCGVLLIISLFLNYFLQSVATGGIVHAIKEIFLNRKVSLGDCVKTVWPLSGKICMARFLVGFIYLGAVILTILMILMNNELLNRSNGLPGSVVVTFVIFCTIIIYTFIIYFTLKYLFVPQIIVLENPDAVMALKRSWGLISGYWWKTMGVVFVIYFILFIAGSLFDWGIFYVGDLVGTIPGMSQYVVIVFLVIFHTLYCLFTYPISLIAYTLLYFNILVVREGFNLEKLEAAGEITG